MTKIFFKTKTSLIEREIIVREKDGEIERNRE